MTQPPVKILDYESYTVQSCIPSISTTVSSKCSYPIASYDTCDHLSSKHQCFLVAVHIETEPTNFSDVVKCSK